MPDIIKEIEARGIKINVVPIEMLKDLKNDIAKLKETETLNGFQKWITGEAYVLELPVPEPDFTGKSIVVTATPFKLVNAVFHHKNKKVCQIFDLGQHDTYDFVKKVFDSHGYKLEYIHWFPQKRLAVRSGIAEYGRNNIVFAEGMGSFIGLGTYKSDMPCNDGEFMWREVKNMDLCNNCRLCIENCPTKAILPDRFLIDNEKCLTATNEAGTEPFPDWIPKTAHHKLTGCLRCQDICPKNRDILNNIKETVEFSEEETSLLLSGTPVGNLPESLVDKVRKYDMEHYYGSIPRNLKAMLENS